MKILVVDDNIENLEMIEFIFKNQGYNVYTAANGKLALDILYKEKIDLIITDILMPVMDGFMLCKECKLDENLAGIPLIFYTATYIDSKDRDFALSLGAIDFIAKPQEPSVLIKIIEKNLQKIRENKFETKGKIEIEENEIMKLYSERLISKLEKKNIDLEKEIESHKKTMQDLENARRKAEESDRLKTAFLQNISHEIRTPLNGIIGFSDLLNTSNITDEDMKDYTKMISGSGRKLLEIINNVLDLSKIETGQVQIKKKVFSLNSMLNDLLIFYKQLNTNENLKFCYTTCIENAESLIVSDEVKLNQILSNLINNAVKFTETGCISFGYEIKETQLQFYVKDTGTGISEEKFTQIFERFAQIDNKNYTRQNGAGLGLAICKGLVEKFGGKIWLESELGVGSTFYFTVPYEPAKIDMKFEDENKSELKKRNLNILVAEDDFTCFTLIKKILAEFDYQIIHTENGLQAVEAVEKNPNIDLVLMDIRMPILDGVEATKRIKKIRPDLPIIAQTAYAFSEEKEVILAIGCNDFITKPIQKNQLIKMINTYTLN